MTKTSEDVALYYLGAEIQVIGTYFTYINVPSSGDLLWSKGTSDDFIMMTLQDSALLY